MSECETCRYKSESWDSEVCDRCTRADSNYEIDLISRKDTIDKAILVPIAKVVPEDKVVYRKVVFIEDIESLLPADRPTGRWISNHDGSWNCSECGLRVLIYAKGNFCPNCGARMKGGAE